MSWCSNLKSSIKKDSKWKPTILMPSTHALMINNHSLCNNLNQINMTLNTHIDIVEFFNPMNLSLICLMDNISKQNSYPPNALFHFEGYNSLDCYKKLIFDIKESAFNSGTVLNTKSSYSQSNKTKNQTYTLVCDHFGKPSDSVMNSKVFEGNCLQANNTIIQQHHYGKSVKHSSRNAKFKRVNSQHTNDKSNRSNTKKYICTFQLSIFF